MASQAELKKRLKVLMNRPENQVCSDCPERQPRWASLIVPPPGSPPGALPIGAFCCLECSGSHRRLGVHISFVRSVNLDSWKEREVQAMENGGNKKVNAIFEARLDQYGALKLHAGADGPTRERYIRDKYERRKYFDPIILRRYYEEESEEDSSSSEEEELAPRRQVNRTPSDAARRRAEARKSHLAGSQPSEPAQVKGSGAKIRPPERPPRKVTPRTAPAPAPRPAPEVDLLDFGTPMSDPGPNPAPPSASPSPTLDLFANMNVSNHGSVDGPNSQQGNSNPSNENSVVTARAQAVDAATNAAATSIQNDQQRKLTSDEILAMFNTPPQQQGFGMGLNGMTMMTNSANNSNNLMMMGTAGGSGPGMMNQPQNSGGNWPAMMMQQQNQQTQKFMMMQQNGSGNANMMMQHQTPQGNMTMMMRQQQQQQQQQLPKSPMGNMMTSNYQPGSGGGFGGGGMGMNQHIGVMNQIQMGNPGMMMPMGGMPGQGAGMHQPQEHPKQRYSQDQFAEFGLGAQNSFRS